MACKITPDSFPIGRSTVVSVTRTHADWTRLCCVKRLRKFIVIFPWRNLSEIASCISPVLFEVT